MSHRRHTAELEIRRQSQELAVAWRKGRAAFVLDQLEAEEPLRAALLATLIDGALARWDPVESKWPNAFRHALLLRSQGSITPYEVAELEREYGRRFGAPPPRPTASGSGDPHEKRRLAELHAKRLRSALAGDRPLDRRPRTPTSADSSRSASPMFLRLQPARR